MKKTPLASKSSFTIKEVVSMYGVSVDTLYYYERLGLVVPARNPANGYRLYQAEDFYRLNIITELRAMGFALDQVSRYLEEHSFASTMTLMNDELSQINEQIKRFNSMKNSVVSSLQRYANAIAESQSEQITILHMKARSCLLVKDGLIDYNDIPYAFAKCAHTHRMRLETLHSTPCYVVDTSTVLDNGCFPPKAILLYTDNPPATADYTLESGLYAACTFAGSLQRSPGIYSDMIGYLAAEGYRQTGDPIEFCLIGEYESDIREEYVSHLEIPVEPCAQGTGQGA